MEQGENKLRAVYEDYLATLDDIEARSSRVALERWDKFLEGRPPEEVDGSRREWFEMAQEESGLPAKQVSEISERVGRFYSWLTLARPAAPPFGGGVAKPSVSRDAGLPTPPPSLEGDPKLWVQGPSLGPPPTRVHTPIAAEGEHAYGAGGPVRNVRAIWVVGVMLASCLLGILPYLFIVTPLARLETDLSVYIRSADKQEMTGLYAWLVPHAQAVGIELDPDAAKVSYEASEAARFGVTKLRYVNISVPGEQVLWGIRREVEISARALSEFEVGAPKAPEIEAVPEVQAAPAAAPKLSDEDVRELRALRARIDTAIANLRATVGSVPTAAQAL
ncbi:MAG: hypothetical protein KDH09_16340, partial [Chrysiogenetes bacterium]|nr:hypothetical protein [Chrysiogenetes bacterium]